MGPWLVPRGGLWTSDAFQNEDSVPSCPGPSSARGFNGDTDSSRNTCVGQDHAVPLLISGREERMGAASLWRRAIFWSFVLWGWCCLKPPNSAAGSRDVGIRVICQGLGRVARSEHLLLKKSGCHSSAHPSCVHRHNAYNHCRPVRWVASFCSPKSGCSGMAYVWCWVNFSLGVSRRVVSKLWERAVWERAMRR